MPVPLCYSARYMAGKKAVAHAEPDTEIISRVYEVGYHINPEAKEDDLEAVVAGIRSIIEKAGGTFIAEGAPSLIKLAYDIPVRASGKVAMYDRAHFGWLKFEAPSTVAFELEASLKKSKDVIRFIVFRTVREDTRAHFKAPQLREVKRTDTLKPTVRRVEESSEPINEEEIDKAIEGLTVE